MSTASNPMGLKRICTNCGMRFYDLNKRPIICPSCDTEFTGEIKIKSRRGRTASSETPKKDEKIKALVAEKEDDTIEDEDEDAGVEVVSLDDLDEKGGDDEEDVVDDGDDNLDDIPDLDIDDELGGDDDDALLDDDED